MCGIWGYIHFGKSSGQAKLATLYETFMNSQVRGPDRSDFKQINEFIQLYLGFHRLAIMNRSAYGEQPFVCEINDNTEQKQEQKSVYAVCNGEIYNHRELIAKYDGL